MSVHGECQLWSSSSSSDEDDNNNINTADAELMQSFFAYNSHEVNTNFVHRTVLTYDPKTNEVNNTGSKY